MVVFMQEECLHSGKFFADDCHVSVAVKSTLEIILFLFVCSEYVQRYSQIIVM